MVQVLMWCDKCKKDVIPNMETDERFEHDGMWYIRCAGQTCPDCGKWLQTTDVLEGLVVNGNNNT